MVTPPADASPSSWPDPDGVDLWSVGLGGDAPALARRALATLDDAERSRAERILRPLARDRFILARTALRTVLGGYLQVEPARVPLGAEPAGKPLLVAPAGLAFSLSHTGGVVVIAVTARARVGVDVERRGRRTPPGVMRRVLDEQELALVLAAPAERRDEAFLRHWTVKEAYVKALGTGIAAGLRRVGVRDALTTPAPAVGAAADAGDWSVQRFDPCPGVVGAVVVAGGPWTARRRDLASVATASL